MFRNRIAELNRNLSVKAFEIKTPDGKYNMIITPCDSSRKKHNPDACSVYIPWTGNFLIHNNFKYVIELVESLLCFDGIRLDDLQVLPYQLNR